MGVSHVLQVLVPIGMLGSCVTFLGAKTTTLLSGFFPAGSNTVPEIVVWPPPGQFMLTLQPEQPVVWPPPSPPTNVPLELPLPPPLLPPVTPPAASSPPPPTPPPLSCRPGPCDPHPPVSTATIEAPRANEAKREGPTRNILHLIEKW